MLGRATKQLWRAAQLADRSGSLSVPLSACDHGILSCIHLEAQQLTSLKAFSAQSSPQPALIRDFAIIGAHEVLGMPCLMTMVVTRDVKASQYIRLVMAISADLALISIQHLCCAAHVDHGKTTLMDRLLAHCGHASAQERFMDSNALEKERGITINSKYTSLQFGDYTLNAVDTPGHADFGGEVER